MAINNGIGRVWAANAGEEGRPAGVGPVWIENIDAITPSGSGGSTYTGGNGIDVDNDNDTISLDDEAQAAIDSYVTNSGSFLTDADLSGYATETWVSSQGYLTSIPSEYVTDTEMSEYVAEQTSAFITSADLPEIKDLVAGDGIEISDSDVVSVSLAENGGLDFKASSIDGQAGGQSVGGRYYAKKFHVGTNPQTDAVASFTLKTNSSNYTYFYDAAYSGYAVLVLANPADLSQYSICSSTLYGPMPYMLVGKYSDYIPLNQTLTVSGSMSTLFGNSWTDYVDENGDIHLYLCDINNNELKGTGYGPGGACAAAEYTTVLTLTSTLAGATKLSVANPVPEYATSNDGMVLGVVNNSGTAEMQWVSHGDIPDDLVTSGELATVSGEIVNQIPDVPTIKDLIAGNGINISATSADVTISADTSVLATQADLGPYATQTWTSSNFFPIDGLQVVSSSAEASGANIIYIVSGSNA